MTQVRVAEESAIHHVDSILGLLLAFSIFLTGTLPDMYVKSGILEVAAATALQKNLAVFLVYASLAWMVGVLRGEWILKSAAWILTLYVLLMLSFYVSFLGWKIASFFVLKPFGGTIIVSLFRVAASLVGVFSACGAYVILWHGVRYAYRGRLLAIGTWSEYHQAIEQSAKWLGMALIAANLIYTVLVFFGIW